MLGGERDGPEARWVLAAGIALIALAWVPPMPLAGAQLSDAICASGVALALATAGTRFPSRAGVFLAVAYGGWATLSTLATGGSWVRLLGAWWLVALATGVAAYARQSDVYARRLRRALVVAALVASATGLVGAVLYAFGISTGLLNHPGDLVPGDYPRIRGTMMRANALAGLSCVGLLLLADVPRRVRVLVALVLGAALLFTFSRSWIALAGAAAVHALALGPRRSSTRDVTAVAIVLGAAAIMLAVSWLGVRLDPTRPWDVQLVEEPGTRWVHLRAAVDTISAHPVIGVGPGGVADPSGWDAHFTLANVAALMGVPAALVLLALYAYALQRSVVAARAGDVAARGIAACLVLFGLDALARDVEDQRALWIVLGLALALRRRRL